MGMTLTKFDWPECPEVRRKRAGDESYDICNLNTKSCLIEHGLYVCPYYENYLEEMKAE